VGDVVVDEKVYSGLKNEVMIHHRLKEENKLCDMGNWTKMVTEKNVKS